MYYVFRVYIFTKESQETNFAVIQKGTFFNNMIFVSYTIWLFVLSSKIFITQ